VHEPRTTNAGATGSANRGIGEQSERIQHDHGQCRQCERDEAETVLAAIAGDETALEGELWVEPITLEQSPN